MKKTNRLQKPPPFIYPTFRTSSERESQRVFTAAHVRGGDFENQTLTSNSY